MIIQSRSIWRRIDSDWKVGLDSFKLTPRIEPEWNRLKFSQFALNCFSDWFGMFPNTDSFRLNLIDNSVKINLTSDWFGIIQIDGSDWAGMNRIESDYYFTDLYRIRFKTFSDWFGMILNQTLDSFWLIRIENVVNINSSSDWLGLKTWFGFIKIDVSDSTGINRIKTDWFFIDIRNDSKSFGKIFRNGAE